MDQNVIEHWAKQDAWSESELADLCCGLEPDRSRANDEETNEARRMIQRAVKARSLTVIQDPNAQPADKLYGEDKLFLLGDAIPWASEKFPKFPAFPLPVAPEVEVGEDKPLPTTSRNTLLRLAIGMAIKGYGYDPRAKKSEVPKTIENDLAMLGIDVSAETVKNWLTEAANTVLPSNRQ